MDVEALTSTGLSALAKQVADQGRRIAALEAEVTIYRETNREMLEALGKLRVSQRVVLDRSLGDGLSSKEKRREYMKHWMRQKRAQSKNGDIDASRIG